MVKTRSFARNLKKVNCDKSAKDLHLAIKKNIHDGQSLQELYGGFISAIETTLVKHAPKRKCSRTVRSNYSWYGYDAKRLKLQQRLEEKRLLKSRNTADLTHYKHINKCYLRYLNHPRSHIFTHNYNQAITSHNVLQDSPTPNERTTGQPPTIQLISRRVGRYIH